MILDRIKTLWRLSGMDLQETIYKTAAVGSSVENLTKKNFILREQAKIIPYNRRDPIKEIIGQPEENDNRTI